MGSAEAFGSPPGAMFSYGAFAKNDSFIRKRYPNVPFTVLEQGGRPKGNWNVIVSTCPCAGLSTFSSAKTGSAQRESMNYWMKMTSEMILGEVKPDVYLGENAPALFTNMGVDVANYMVEMGKKHGYGVSFYKTSSVKHGLPQRRPRTFYFFWKGGKAPVLPYVSRDTPRARDYLEPLRNVPSEGFGPVLTDDSSYQFLRMRFGDGWRNGGSNSGAEYNCTLEALTKTGTIGDYVANWDGVKDSSWKTAKRKLEKESGNVFSSMPAFPRYGETYSSVIAKCIKGLVHPVEDRFLTYREASSLMGIPYDFELPEIKDFNIICQNVPVPTARDVTEFAIDFVGGKLIASDEEVTWTDNMTQKQYVGGEKLTTRNPGVEHIWA